MTRLCLSPAKPRSEGNILITPTPSGACDGNNTCIFNSVETDCAVRGATCDPSRGACSVPDGGARPNGPDAGVFPGADSDAVRPTSSDAGDGTASDAGHPIITRDAASLRECVFDTDCTIGPHPPHICALVHCVDGECVEILCDF